MKRVLFILTLWVLTTVVSFAQDRAQGMVNDNSGRGLAGVSVTVQGTRTGTLTDLNGTFFLEGVTPGSVLEVSAIGYKTQKVIWNNRPLTIVLKEKGDGHFFVMGSVAIASPMNYGVTVGYVDKLGFYVTARHNFKFAMGAQEARNGLLSDGTALWTTANAKAYSSVFHIGGGVAIRAAKWLYPYAGVSYRKYDVIWEDYRGQKIKMANFSSSSFGIGAGAMFRFGMFGFSGGLNYFIGEESHVEAEAGIGLFF